MDKFKIIKSAAVLGNAAVLLWISYMMISKGFPKSGVDISLTILVYVTIISSLITLTRKNK